MNKAAWNQGLDHPKKRTECFSPGQDLKEEDKRVSQSAIARLVTPKLYQYKQVCEWLDQQKRDRKRTDAALMREDTTIDTYSPPSEVKVKNVHVQKVEEWIIFEPQPATIVSTQLNNTTQTESS